MRLTEYLLGTCELSIRTPWPETVLKGLEKLGVRFWNLEREGDLVRFRILLREEEKSTEQLKQLGFFLAEKKAFGLPVLFKTIIKSWVLLFGLVFAVCLLLYLESRIWFFEVHGNETIPTEQILQCLEEIGIGPGTSQKEIDPQIIKNQMLQRIPELEWISVNKRGAHGEVLVQERRSHFSEEIKRPVSSLVAARPGVIVEMNVYRGYAVTEVGKAVLEGELLVSGFGSGWDEILCCRAKGEVFALTQHQSERIMPVKSARRKGNADKTSRWSIVIGKKRLNFFRNSGIALTGYDKIEQKYPCILPGGIQLPLSLVKTTFSHYETEDATTDENLAFSILSESESRQVRSELIAGTILDTEAELSSSSGLYHYHANTTAREMIARTQEENPLGE